MRTLNPLKLLYAYVLAIAAWFVAWAVAGDAVWWLTLLNRMVPYLFVPVPLFAIHAVWMRRHRPLLLLFIPLAIFAGLYHPYVVPRAAMDQQHVANLAVMTYNVLFHNSRYKEVAGIILEYQPDLVALQEVQPDMMETLRTELSALYPYSLMGDPNDYGTTAVFSRFPLSEAYVLDLAADRPAVVVETTFQNKPVTFVALHLRAYGLWWAGLKNIPTVTMQRTREQNRQVEILLDELEKKPGIVVVGCDCNTRETSSSYRLLESSLKNAAFEVGWKWMPDEFAGVRKDLDLQHIDYIWYRGLLHPVGIYTIRNSAGSDHVPVIATFHVN